MTDTGNNPDPGTPLVERELQCLVGASRGHTNAEIGRVLGLSEDTIKTYMRRAFRRLGVADHAHAVALAYQQGLLVMPADATPRITADGFTGTLVQHLHRATYQQPTPRSST